ncbi:MAG: host attachment protein [Propionibacteriaceae bacterium]|nr:host attachment protein [Propionibacteriaceae bacterium]
MPTYPTMTLLSELADARPEGGVVSLYLDTDPRKPENTSSSPAWLVELRNQLSAVGEAIDAAGDRDTVLAWREASGRIEERVRDLPAAARGRSLALFTTVDGAWERVVSSQLPVRAAGGSFDDRPHIAPLADLADRGRPIGIVTVDSDEMALLVWADGRIADADETGVASDLDAYRSTLQSGEGGHAPRLRTHAEQLGNRADEHGRKFLAEAAATLASGLGEVDVDALVIVHGAGVLGEFVDNLPAEVADTVAATIEANVTGVDANTLVDRIADDLDAVARSRGEAVAADAVARAASGGAGAVGAQTVLKALAEHRVSELVVAPDLDLDEASVGPVAETFLADVPAELMVERVLGQAISTGAAVTVTESSELSAVGGIAALLRW